MHPSIRGSFVSWLDAVVARRLGATTHPTTTLVLHRSVQSFLQPSMHRSLHRSLPRAMGRSHPASNGTVRPTVHPPVRLMPSGSAGARLAGRRPSHPIGRAERGPGQHGRPGR